MAALLPALPEGADAMARSQARYRRIAVSAGAAFLARGLAILVNLLIVPALLLALGVADFGIWALLSSVGLWFAVLDLGITNGLVNLIAESYGRSDAAAARRAVATAFLLVLASAGTAALLLVSLSGAIPWGRLLGLPDSIDPRLVRDAVLAAVLPALLGLPLGLVRQIWIGYQKAYLASLVLAGGAVVTGLGVMLVMVTRPGLPLTLVATGIGPLLAGICGYLWLFGRDMPTLRPRFSGFDRSMARRLLRLSLPLALFQIGAILVNNTQLLVIAHRADLVTTANYSIIIRLYGAVIGLVMLGTQPFVPSFREAYERADHEWVRRSFRLMITIRLTATIAAALILALAGNWLVRLWLHDATMSFPAPVWLILGLLLVATVWATSYSELLIIMDRILPQVALVLLNGVATTALTWILVPRFGIAGAAAALVSFVVLVNAWAIPMMARPIFRLSPSRRRPAASPPRPGLAEAPCRLCGGTAVALFQRRLLRRHDVQYLRCRDCGSLETEEPYWLGEAYEQAIGSSDVGAVQRSLTNRAALWWILKVSRLPHAKLLDFGGGTGLLCRLLRDIGIDAWTADAYEKGALAQHFQVEWAAVRPGSFEIITAIEVIEHFARPAEELSALFAREPALLVVSTELYRAESGAEWWYLAAEGGQHVFFYSEKALRQFAAAAGYGLLRRGAWCLFFHHPPGWLAQKLLSLVLGNAMLRLTRLWLESKPSGQYVASDYRHATQEPDHDAR